MQEAITYVGIDAHKKNLAIAMLIGHERTPTTWPVANEPRAVERFAAEAALCVSNSQFPRCIQD